MSLEEHMIEFFGERYGPPKPLCYHCGQECSGDVTESICIDGMKGEMPICDDPDFCPANS
jgi:hypothetical protein